MSKLLSLPRALLFDLDGTLADTAPDLAAAVNKMRTDRELDETPFDLLRPLASAGARGLIGAALLAASILPLSTAYAVTDLTGRPAALDDKANEAPLFYATFAAITVVAATLVLIPGAPLIRILVLTQILNAVLLLPLLLYMFGIAKDARLMGEYKASSKMLIVYSLIIAVIFICVATLLWLTLAG